MASSPVFAKPARANARVAASRTCSRRRARGIRWVGSARTTVTSSSSCLTSSVQVALSKSSYTSCPLLEGGVMTSTQLPHGSVHRVRTPGGHWAWLVTDYGQVRRRLDDDRLGRSHPEPQQAA